MIQHKLGFRQVQCKEVLFYKLITGQLNQQIGQTTSLLP